MVAVVAVELTKRGLVPTRSWLVELVVSRPLVVIAEITISLVRGATVTTAD